jgi:hypothetical protein
MMNAETNQTQTGESTMTIHREKVRGVTIRLQQINDGYAITIKGRIVGSFNNARDAIAGHKQFLNNWKKGYGFVRSV